MTWCSLDSVQCVWLSLSHSDQSKQWQLLSFHNHIHGMDQHDHGSTCIHVVSRSWIQCCIQGWWFPKLRSMITPAKMALNREIGHTYHTSTKYSSGSTMAARQPVGTIYPCLSEIHLVLMFCKHWPTAFRMAATDEIHLGKSSSFDFPDADPCWRRPCHELLHAHWCDPGPCSHSFLTPAQFHHWSG